ncbi:hypothetical protein PsAD46_02146 [Pseudovibrio sp. Ad46]|uniref:hypothetical protein n=1 Tax=Pseudovibrio sp. Ad46 TaxID=989432 RepID=UPI0007B2CADC|nr:hypothetical protein [Pseudovibrio sp. Ad46]KZK90525.1 hypothetical protein PsAD46_02146 [Pseudovibrio sp. Ad46]
MALIVTVSYTSAENYMTSLMLLIAVFAVVNIPSISIWALSGSALRTLLAKGNRIALFNVSMALLLITSMAPALRMN